MTKVAVRVCKRKFQGLRSAATKLKGHAIRHGQKKTKSSSETSVSVMTSESSTAAAAAASTSKIIDESGTPLTQPAAPTHAFSNAEITIDDDETVEEHVKKCLQDADELKQEGTVHFRAGMWAQALATYTSALGRLPKRVAEPRPFVYDLKQESAAESDQDDSGKAKEEEPTPEPVPLTGLELDGAMARSVLNANIGACHVKLEEYKEAVNACNEALADDPNYIKALQRRASCNEKIGSWSSLGSAQEDYNTLLKILPPDSPQLGAIRRALAALKPRLEDAQKKETGEVLEKLKGLGNSILGNFGLSTDNFKFQPNGQGGYSVNFSQ
ncbi:hypothetical protein EW145_g7010 [Phellinidium pouzarii]|uniref:Uncharacterized protein n=1 Tax=Phellinidium pouzarii TaxID=167371 RepID=A0A4S4KQM1_9AGAM|nr:hypothetical protein EW145_g7010 [Phellinidium pouzarii]